MVLVVIVPDRCVNHLVQIQVEVVPRTKFLADYNTKLAPSLDECGVNLKQVMLALWILSVDSVV